MKNIIVGTAGHIDHGKTTLIKALTGRNTDRWEEEKRRGITIDLGFTYFDLPSERRVGIIDVPGHEKFVNNMVVGVVGMDLVLLVIAADEGIMPQTREHIDIISQLGADKSIVVLNKCDLVDDEWLQLVREDLKEELKDTMFEGAPVAEVSAASGQGMEQLIALIDEMTEEIEERDIYTIPRLPVDRVFSLSGFGTIVTGTLISGQMKKNDQLQIFPSGQTCKIRSIQVHGEDQEVCYAGQRAAMNLTNIKKDEIHRGCVAAPVDCMKNTMMLDVRLNVLKSSMRVISNRTRLRLFTGTSETLCRAVLLDKEEAGPGESCLAQLRLEDETAVRKGDKFIVRFYSPMETVGGGVILDANPVKKKRFHQESIDELHKKEEGSHGDTLELLIKEHSSTTIKAAELGKLAGLSKEEVQEETEELAGQNKITVFQLQKDVYFWHKDFERKIISGLIEDLEKFHKQNPFKLGMKKSEIRMKYLAGLKQNLFDIFIQNCIGEELLKQENEFISKADFVIEKNDSFLKVEKKIKTSLGEAEYDFVKFAEIDFGADASAADDILQHLVSTGEVVKISPEYYTTDILAGKAADLVKEHFKNDNLITMVQIRDMLDTSRKNVKLLLEYLDTIRITKKHGPESERIAYK